MPTGKAYVAIASLIAIFMAFSFVMFFISYRSLNKSIQEERTKAASEIGNAVVQRIELLQSLYLDEVFHYARIMESNKPTTLEEVDGVFTDDDEIIIIMSNSICKDTKGNELIVRDTTFLNNF